MIRKPIIAIDGTAASGKSTTARKVAEHFQYLYIDTGAMYRAVTLLALRQGVDVNDFHALADVAEQADISLGQSRGRTTVFIGDEDVTDEIRTPDVTRHVSAVSEAGPVREILVDRQRQMASGGGVVMEGRDIGTVVFPDADVKIFMKADSSERARRRHQEMKSMSVESAEEQVEEALLRRDQWDSSRDVSPLKQAADAFVVDTTDLTIEEQVRSVIDRVEQWLDHMERNVV